MNLDKDEGNSNEQEKRILRLIKRIKKDRNRPCFQNILSFANREDDKLTMDDLKIVTDKMVAQNLIADIGVNGKESFSILEDNITSTESISSGTQTNKENGDEGFKNLENFIDTSFYETIVNLIKGEVKNVLSDLKLFNENSELTVNSSQQDNECTKDNDSLYLELRNQITFLQNELKSKDTIIKMLINERNNVNNINCDVSRKLNSHTVNDLNFNLTESSVITRSGNNIPNDKKSTGKMIDEKFNTHQKSMAKINQNTSNPTSNMAACVETNDIIEQNDIENKNTRKKRTTVIFGDSIINVIEQHKFKEGLGNNERVYVKSFSGADVESMRSHVIPSKKFENDVVILHCGTNDLRGIKSAEEIATNIINLAKEMKSEKNEVMVSGIIPRNDNLNEKGIDVNNILITFCTDFNFNFIDNSNINKVTI